MVNRCTVPLCTVTSTKGFFRIPKDPKLRAVWLRRIGNPTLDKISQEQITTRRVCRRHFQNICMAELTSKDILKYNALPTDHLPTFFEPTEENCFYNWDALNDDQEVQQGVMDKTCSTSIENVISLSLPASPEPGCSNLITGCFESPKRARSLSVRPAVKKRRVSYKTTSVKSRKAFQSTGKNRIMKTGGTITILGACPSRMIVTFNENGRVAVKFLETHVIGHEEEVRTQRLTKKEQAYLIEQVKAGVSKKRIISNARNSNLSESGLPGRLNTISRKDMWNLCRRYNLENIKHHNDMITKTMEAEEWNVNEKICHDHEYSIKSSACKNTVAPAMPELRWLVPDTIDEHDVVQSASDHNRTAIVEGSFLKKRKSTQAINSYPQRQIFREHCINFVNEMCAVDENAYDVFKGRMNFLELQMRQTLEQISKKK